MGEDCIKNNKKEEVKNNKGNIKTTYSSTWWIRIAERRTIAADLVTMMRRMMSTEVVARLIIDDAARIPIHNYSEGGEANRDRQTWGATTIQRRIKKKKPIANNRRVTGCLADHTRLVVVASLHTGRCFSSYSLSSLDRNTNSEYNWMIAHYLVSHLCNVFVCERDGESIVQ